MNVIWEICCQIDASRKEDEMQFGKFMKDGKDDKMINQRGDE